MMVLSKAKDFFRKPKPIIEVLNTEYITLRVTPDSSVRNHRTEDIIRTIADQFRLPIDRIVRDGLRIKGYRIQERAAFEMAFEHGRVRFYFHVPRNIAPLLIKRIASVWDKATIEEINKRDPLFTDNVTIFESLYRKHDMYSMHTNATDNKPLDSLLEAGKLLNVNENASIFIYLDPMHQLTHDYEMTHAWDKLRGGNVPRKVVTSKREMLKNIITSFTSLLTDLFASMPGNVYAAQPSDPEAMRFTIEHLSDSTKKKAKMPGIKTYVWTIVSAANVGRSEMVARTLATSFNDLAGDNELIGREVKNKNKATTIMRTYDTKRAPNVPMHYNKMSVAEASKLVQLPGLELQEKYPEIVYIDTKEVEIANEALTDPNGIYIGDITYKGTTEAVYAPTHDKDELCLPRVTIGGMGQGKTKGLLSNYLLECACKGFGGLAVDPAKGEIGDQLDHAVRVGVLDANKYQRYNLGVTPFSLDFCEALYDERARARLANLIVHFFGVADETTGQTERFLRAAVLGMQTGKVNEIMRIFENENYLDETIQRLEAADDEFNLSTLREYKSYSVAMRRKILSPIYNRLNDIMGDPFLSKCMRSENSIDLVKIMSTNKAYVFDVLAADLDKVAIDIIVSLLSLKIDLAMRMRKKVTGNEDPFFVLIDEPHQFTKSTKVWESAVVESRKWRVGYFWSFHYWEQIPFNLQKAIRNALPHYHLYPTTSTTYKSLENEIYPFTVKDALKMKRFHAINIIRTDGENAVPFIAKMAAPPMVRFK